MRYDLVRACVGGCGGCGRAGRTALGRVGWAVVYSTAMEKTEKLRIGMSQWVARLAFPVQDRGMGKGLGREKKDYAGSGRTQTERE